MGKSMHPDLVKERRMGDLLKGSFGFMGFVFQGDMYSMYSLFQPHMKDFIFFESLMTMKHYDDLVHMGFLNHHRPLTIPPRKAGHLSPKKVTSRSAKSNFFFQEKMTHKTTPKPSHHGSRLGSDGFLIVSYQERNARRSSSVRCKVSWRSLGSWEPQSLNQLLSCLGHSN